MVCLHGWMDNAASFDLFIPHLLRSFSPSVCVLALDLAGHGKSSHEPGGNYTVTSYASSVLEALDTLVWDSRLVLVGHSMGGGVATIIAGAFPERMSGLVLLDSAGPPVRSPTEAPDNFSKSVAFKAVVARKPGGSVYPTMEDGVKARMTTVASHPPNKFGPQCISEACARALVERCMVPTSAGEQKGWTWTFDPRIKVSSSITLGEDAILEYLRRVAACIPALLLRARNGWPYSEALLVPRLAALAPTVEELPGYHHFHRDPDTAAAVGERVCNWLRKQGLAP